MAWKPVIAIAGLACENSTFTPSRTAAAAFQPRRGREIIDHYAFLHQGTPLGDAANWKGALIGHALPGGIVTKDAYETLAGEIVSRLRDIVDSTPLDGLWFDIHGAMFVEGFVDIEAELLRRIRSVIGPVAVVSASMDLHGNVSRDLAHQVDLITCYRTAPHVDVFETRERACRNLVKILGQRSMDFSTRIEQRLPLKAWVPIPILLPGEMTSTRLEPAKHIYEAVSDVEADEGVLDAAVWVGYAWADEPRNRAVVVVTGYEESTVRNGAEKLAHLFWNARKDFRFVAPHGSFFECLDAALASRKRPYFVSDSGDNPTAGGAGDVTWTLERLLDREEFRHASGPKVIYASIPGADAIRIAVDAGIGSTVTVNAGAEVDNKCSGAVTMTGIVHSIKHGDRWAVTEVVVQVGSPFVILTERRKPYHREQDFTELNLDPRHGADIVIVKIGYLEPELYEMAADWMLALTPGGVDQDLERLGHERIQRPMWPFDKDFDAQPDLSARFIAESHKPLAGQDE